MKKLKLTAIALVLAAVTTGVVVAEEKKAEKVKPYPLKTCVTDGEKLGSMGKPYTFVHEGREIKLCCKGCEEDFKKDSAKYMKKLDEADKAAEK